MPAAHCQGLKRKKNQKKMQRTRGKALKFKIKSRAEEGCGGPLNKCFYTSKVGLFAEFCPGHVRGS
jgi:hypothetical protein